MKRYLLYLILIINCTQLKAQSLSITEVSPSCDSNGVLAATITGYTPPFIISWYTYTSYHTDTIYGMTDTLRNFPGGFVDVYLYQITAAYDTMAFGDFSNVISVSVNSDTVICPALATLTATVSGGTPPYTYAWSNGTTGAAVGSVNPMGSLPEGNYILKVTDHSGCYTQLGSIDHGIQVNIYPDFGYYFTSTNGAVCPAADTQIIHYSGGTPPFTFAWYSGYPGTSGTTLLGTHDTLLIVPTGYIQDYGQITDALGCTAVQVFDVTATADFIAVANTAPANCTNGSASLSITGGVPPFAYNWSTGATTDSITGLVQGAYTVNISDSLGCTSNLSVYVPQAITIAVNLVPTYPTCTDSNGVIAAFSSGGAPPYNYLWNTGATASTIGGLSPSYYTAIATDANGCTGSSSINLPSTSPILVAYNTTPSSCTVATGTASLTITGGTSPYTVTWYTTPAISGPYATGLAAGNYYFYITDAAGCSQSGTITVPPVDVISLSFTANPSTCTMPNGAVIVSASGGVGPYTYAWAGSSSASSTLTGITSGTYYATVTDANHCEVTNCQYVPFTSPLVLGLSTTDASCLYTADGTLTATASLGTPPYNYTLGGSSAGSVTVPHLAAGEYYEYVTDSMGCIAEQYFAIGYNVTDSSCFCVLKGNVYYDAPASCTKIAGDPNINNIQINCNPFGYTYTDTGGNYYFLLPSGTYTISENVLAFYPLSPCQINTIPITVTAASGCVITQNFADTVNPIHDMSIYSWDYTFAIPGNPYVQATLITNNGTDTENNILASYTPDGQLYSPTFVPSGIFTGTPYFYNTAASPYILSPGSSTLFLNSYHVPVGIPLGTNVVFRDSVASQGPMSNWLSDYSPWNNVDYFTTTVVASHDPNYKEVSPTGSGPLGYITYSDSILTYMIHFQNTGTFNAQNVVVRDTLDPNLDWTTLRPLYMQYEGKADMDNSGHVTFTFNNINLPYADANPVSSNAMFTYTIKTKSSMPIGTTFKNRASIYFDYNPPVMTNQTVNTLWFPASVANVNNGGAYSTFNIYPNPASDKCYAQINSDEAGNAEIRIIDITGKTTLHQTLTLTKGNQDIPINLGNYAPGVYFVTIYGMGKTQTQKLVVLQ